MIAQLWRRVDKPSMNVNYAPSLATIARIAKIAEVINYDGGKNYALIILCSADSIGILFSRNALCPS